MWIYLLAALVVLLVVAFVFFLDLPWFVAGAFALLVAVALAIRFAYRTLKARRASAKLERALVAEQAAAGALRPDQEAEIEALRGEFGAAVSALLASRLGGGRSGRAALYALPWYVIIGPPGAGKSTAIRSSGLTFPYLSGRGGGVRGVGGTRNCEWWLTNQAVILDTAGRYTTEDDDRAEWLAFLDLLQKTRAPRPLNGLILAISVADVAGATDHGLEELAQKVRERLDEVIGRLRVVAPVYVLFTKCDLLPGFVETFEDLPRSERGQVFGFTFPHGRGDDCLAELDSYFDRLVGSLERRVIARFGNERRLEARERIYGFPQQLEALRPRLSALLSSVFVDNVYQEAPLLRGVYFTSGTQEGRPIDQVMGSMARAFGIEPRLPDAQPVVEARSYFLGDLFTNVMFEDRDLAAGSEAEHRRRVAIRTATSGALCGVAMALLGVATRSYVANRDLVTSTRDMASALVTPRPGTDPSVAALDALTPIRERLELLRTFERDGAPLAMGAGLYVGGELEPSVRRLYQHAIRRVLVEPTIDVTTRSLRARVDAHEGGGAGIDPAEHARLYDELREYLLLTEPREPHEPALDDEKVAFLVQRVASRFVDRARRDATPDERARVEGHVRTYLELLRTDANLAFRRDDYLVRRAREVLAQVPPARVAVNRLVSQIEPLGWTVDLASIVGSSGGSMNATAVVRGAFTRRAWDEAVRELLAEPNEAVLGERWVLEAAAVRPGEGGDDARLCELRSEYFARYIDEWKTFVTSIEVVSPGDARRALSLTQYLTRGDPAPMERLMRSVGYHMRLEATGPSPVAQAGAALQQTALDALRQRLGGLGGAAVDAAQRAGAEVCAGDPYVQRADVERALEGFALFGVPRQAPAAVGDGAAAPPPAGPTPVQVYQEQMELVRDAIRTYMDDPTTSQALVSRLQQAKNEIGALIEEQDVGWRARFDALLYAPLGRIDEASRTAVARARGGEWCTAVVDGFDRTLRGRYPFVRNGQDAAISDVADFYRPNAGTLWTFYREVLERDVPRAGAEFRAAQGQGVGNAYVPALATFLERSLAIAESLFPSGSSDPRVDFEIRIRPTSGIATTTLEIDGLRIVYDNGPEQWHRARWPGAGDAHGARLRVRGARVDETIEHGGDWGFVRLLDSGTLRAVPGERHFSVAFRPQSLDADVVIDVRPARVVNPFVPLGQAPSRFLEPFRAAGALAPRAITPGGGCGGGG